MTPCSRILPVLALLLLSILTGCRAAAMGSNDGYQVKGSNDVSVMVASDTCVIDVRPKPAPQYFVSVVGDGPNNTLTFTLNARYFGELGKAKLHTLWSDCPGKDLHREFGDTDIQLVFEVKDGRAGSYYLEETFPSEKYPTTCSWPTVPNYEAAPNLQLEVSTLVPMKHQARVSFRWHGLVGSFRIEGPS